MKSLIRFFQMIIIKTIGSYVISYSGNIWKVKEKAKNNVFYRNLYYYHLNKNNCWIGHNATFKGIPVFPHGLSGIFISDSAEIGENAVIFHQVTIGSNTILGSNFGSPVIGKNSYLGAGAKIIGNVIVGDNCRVGANTVVVKNMEDNSVAVPVASRFIKKELLDNRYYTKRGVNQEWHYYNNGNWILDKNYKD